MPVEPVPRAQVIRRRLESQGHLKAMLENLAKHEPRVDLLQLPAKLQAPMHQVPPVADGKPALEIPETVDVLVPSGMPAFLTGTLEARHTMLIDCRALDADQIKQIWYSWPDTITEAQVACVLIINDPQCLVLAADGACLELIPADDSGGSPAEKFLAQSRMDFVKRKYGVEKAIRAEIYFRL